MKHTSFLDIANEDLKASNLMLENQLYPQALYHSEQSVEKICKYILLKDDIISEKDLKNKVRHNGKRVFEILIKHLKKTIGNLTLPSTYSNDIVNSFNGLLNELDTYLKTVNEQNTMVLEPEKLDLYLGLLGYYRLMGSSIRGPYDILFKSPELFIQLGIDSNIFDSETVSKTKKLMSNEETRILAINIMKEILGKTPLYQNLTFRLVILAMIFSSHHELTRYPDPTSGKKPNEIFDLSNPLITKLGALNHHINNVILGFRDIGI
jgi:hypothetical protein